MTDKLLRPLAVAYIVMAFIGMAYAVMAYTVIACTVMADIVMGYTVMPYIVMAYTVMAVTVMAYMSWFRFNGTVLFFLSRYIVAANRPCWFNTGCRPMCHRK